MACKELHIILGLVLEVLSVSSLFSPFSVFASLISKDANLLLGFASVPLEYRNPLVVFNSVLPENSFLVGRLSSFLLPAMAQCVARCTGGQFFLTVGNAFDEPALFSSHIQEVLDGLHFDLHSL